MRSVLCVVLGLPLIACGGGAARAPTPEVAPVVNPQAEPAVVTGTPGCPVLPTTPVIEYPAVGGTTVTLLNPGEPPRRALRYHAPEGTRTTSMMSLDMDLDTGAMQIVMPTMVMTVVTDVLSVGDDAVSTRIVYDESHAVVRDGVSDQLVEAMNQSLGALNCTTVVMRTDARGTGLGSEVFGLSYEQAGSFEQMQGVSYVLPHEEVGLGASWELHTHRATSGIEVEMTIIIDVVAIDGERVELRSTIAGTAPAQHVDTGTATFELRSMQVLGEGTTTVHLGTMEQDGWFKMDTAMDAVIGGNPTKMTTRIEARIANR